MKKTSNNKNEKDNRGRKSNYTDVELKEFALSIKNKLKGSKLTYLQLEKETGIGRNTWARRISETIDELNRPVLREHNISGIEDVYFPNILQMFELYGHDTNKIINALLEFELMYQNLYYKEQVNKKEIEAYKRYKDELPTLIEENKLLKQRVSHYEVLYKSLMVSSAFPHISEDIGIKDNLIKLERNLSQSTALDQLNSFFHDHSLTEIANESYTLDDRKQKNLNTLKSFSPNLWNEKDEF